MYNINFKSIYLTSIAWLYLIAWNTLFLCNTTIAKIFIMYLCNETFAFSFAKYSFKWRCKHKMSENNLLKWLIRYKYLVTNCLSIYSATTTKFTPPWQIVRTGWLNQQRGLWSRFHRSDVMLTLSRFQHHSINGVCEKWKCDQLSLLNCWNIT